MLPKHTHAHLEELVIAFLYAANILLVLDLQLVKVDVMESIAHIILLSELTLHLVISGTSWNRSGRILNKHKACACTIGAPGGPI